MRSGAPLASALGARLSGLVIARGGARARIDARLIRFAEYLLAAAIGVALVTTLITLGGPVLTPSAAPRQSIAPISVAVDGPINPFATAGGGATLPEDFNASPNIAETTLNLVLHGTWLDANGGAAIIKTQDEKQSRFAAGDTIANGVTLERVYADQVIINRGGVRESLRLINREIRPGGGASALSEQGFNSESAATIGGLIAAEPRVDDVGSTRLALTSAGDSEAFEALGFREGDLLVAIDNQLVADDFGRGLEAIASLAGKASVTISVERDGVVMPIRVNLADLERAQDE